jgi:hypothetical protein
MAGCSSTQFFYNRLDTIIAWYVDDYVDLDRQQSQLFDEELEQFFVWHRRTELPRYVDLLVKAEATLDQDIDVTQLQRLADDFRAALERLRARALDSMLRIGDALSDEQLAEFVANLEREQVESEEEYLSRDDAEYREVLIERLEDNFEDYLGRLTTEQRSQIEQSADRYSRLDQAWLEDRARWIQLTRDILSRRDADWQAQIRQAASGRRDARNAVFQEALDANTRVTLDLVAQVLNTRTERQDRRLRKRLAELKDDFEALILEAPPADATEAAK